jgi:uncharacterized protein
MRADIIGRLDEKRVLERILKSNEPELLALYGRRRVGKTHLIRNYFEGHDTYFELTGQRDATLEEQLGNFADVFGRRFVGRHRIEPPATWSEALRFLAREIDERPTKGKVILFFDELPWLASRRSGFLSALDYLWNAWASKRRDVVVVVCGSAASWMIDNIVHNTGGLHNRITELMRLVPFTLAESTQYLQSRRIHLDHKQVLELYMVTGGVPHYLRQVRRGRSAAQNIDRMCFSKDGALADEFHRLYASLFTNSKVHEKVVRVLAGKRRGLTRSELLKAAALESGGGVTKILRALSESGFISSYVPFGKKSKDAVYRLADEYSMFYLTWIRNAPRSVFLAGVGGYWIGKQQSRSWSAWAGFTFEGICQKHVMAIKRALGIGGVATTESGWMVRPKDATDNGAQIDLLIDRADNCITLCEMKFSDSEFVITKTYAGKLRNKRDVFRAHAGTRKTVFIVMITTYGTKENTHYQQLIDQQLTLDSLFIV